MAETNIENPFATEWYTRTPEQRTEREQLVGRLHLIRKNAKDEEIEVAANEILFRDFTVAVGSLVDGRTRARVREAVNRDGGTGTSYQAVKILVASEVHKELEIWSDAMAEAPHVIEPRKVAMGPMFPTAADDFRKLNGEGMF
jgi:hypothetical protein